MRCTPGEMVMENISMTAPEGTEKEIVAELPVFIVNPIAGAGLAEELFARAEKKLRALGMAYRVMRTERPGQASELAKQAIEDGARYIISVGGDGTLSEISSAVCGQEDVKLGILPFGTGNDFAACVSIPTEPEEAAELIFRGTAKRTDLGSANGRIFTNVAGFGFDVDVLRSVEEHKGRGGRGMLPYVLGILDAILHRKKIHCRVSIDGQEQELDALIVTACNGSRFGGGMIVAPEAVPDDGLFDICIARWVGFFRLVTLLPKFIKGKHIGKKPVIYCRAKSLTVTTEGKFTVELDGELNESTPLECRILPGAMNIVRP